MWRTTSCPYSLRGKGTINRYNKWPITNYPNLNQFQRQGHLKRMLDLLLYLQYLTLLYLLTLHGLHLFPFLSLSTRGQSSWSYSQWSPLPTKYALSFKRWSQDRTITVHVPFTLPDSTQYKQKLGRFPEEPIRYTKEFQALTFAYIFTWADLHTILSTCCTKEENQHIWAEAQKHADDWAIQYPNGFSVGALEVPVDAANWNHQKRHVNLQLWYNMVACVLARKRKCFIKSVNQDNAGKGWKSSHAAGIVSRTTKNYTNTNPESPAGQI